MLFVKHKLTQASLTWPLISRPFSNLFAFLLFPNRTEPSCFGMTYLSFRVRDSFTLQTHKFRMWLCECVWVWQCSANSSPTQKPIKITHATKLTAQKSWNLPYFSKKNPSKYHWRVSNQRNRWLYRMDNECGAQSCLWYAIALLMWKIELSAEMAILIRKLDVFFYLRFNTLI